jgi:hypoxia up-regulated 1
MAMVPRTLSPLGVFLCTVFFFSTNVFAVAAVLGVDLGTEYIKAALVKPGIPLEIVLTKDSRRKEISAVAFKPPQNGPKAGSYPERAYGSDAMAIAARFPGDVYPNLKALLGMPVGDSIVQDYAARHPALQLEANKVRNTASFKSKAFTVEEDAWMVEELLAMELKSIQGNAETAAGSPVRSIVLTVPPFYTTEEKRAVQMAAQLAGLKVLGLISDGLAVGLNYATTRQFPNLNEGGKPEYHMVFDMGAGSVKATVMKFQSRTVKDVGKFNKTIQEVQVMGTGWDRTLGGDALNSLIVDDMISQFVESKGAQKIAATADNVKAHGRAIAKLSKEAERLRHVLSANSNTQASFEGLYEDVDFKYKITRADFEKMAEAHIERVNIAVTDALKMAQLEMADLTSVILHGGASRTPFVQKQLEQVVGAGDKIRTNVNSDESAVFGAGFRAAELSPSFRVKEIRISEGSYYATGMKWTNPKDKLQHQRLWTPISPFGAVAKEVTFANHDDFSVDFYQQVGEKEQAVKVMSTKNLTATVSMLKEKYSCADANITFKVGMKLASENGEVDIIKASAECEAEEPEKETFVDGVKNLFGFGKNKEQQPLKDDDTSEDAESSTTTESTSTETSSSTTSASSAAPSAETGEATKHKQLVVIPVEILMEKTGIPTLSQDDLKKAKDRIKAFENSDKERRLREEALNQLEGYTYKARDLLESESFIAASTDKEREKIQKQSGDASEWLYGDGADAPKDDLKKKLKVLQDLITPVQKRIDEAAKRPELISGLKDALNQSTVFIDTIRKQIDEYDAWHASASASSASATSGSSSTATEAPAKSSGDFDGLEDDDQDPASMERTMEDVAKEIGPIPPLYKKEDLIEVEGIWKSTTAWLKEMEEKQNALPPTADPVLLVKDLTSRRDKLDKAGMDLAMKSVRNYESNIKKESKKASAKAGKKTGKPTKSTPGVTINAGATAKSSATGDAEAEPTLDFNGFKDKNFINIGKNGEMPSDEEIMEMLRKQGIKMEDLNVQKGKKADEDGKKKLAHDEL